MRIVRSHGMWGWKDANGTRLFANGLVGMLVYVLRERLRKILARPVCFTIGHTYDGFGHCRVCEKHM